MWHKISGSLFCISQGIFCICFKASVPEESRFSMIIKESRVHVSDKFHHSIFQELF